MTEQTDAQVRWQTTPRPLNFVRIRLERGGQAEFIRSVLETTKTVLLDKLGQLREDGLPEDDPAPVTAAPIPMPPEIAVAILQIMKAVKPLSKDGEVTEGKKFKYVSVDQFFEMLGPLMAEAGLLTVLHEVGAEISPSAPRSVSFRAGSSMMPS